MKKNIIFITCFCFLGILLGICLYFWWISPPLGSDFEIWQDANLAWESVEQKGVSLQLKEIRRYKYNDERSKILVKYCIRNKSENPCVYEDVVYKVDFYCKGNWHTVFLSNISYKNPEVCPVNEEVYESFSVPEEVLKYKGKYRFYLLDVGYLEFEITGKEF